MKRSISGLLLILAIGLSAVSSWSDGEADALQRILFGSCLDPSKPHPILDRIASEKPDLFLFLGDNIYADTTSARVMQAKYEELAKSSGFQRLAASSPLLAVWDDHDYGANDAGADFPIKRESRRLFLDFWKVPPDSPRRAREGIYDSQVFGPADRRVQVILLDTRYFRSPLRWGRFPARAIGPYLPDPDPQATILGEEQWRWLERQLAEPARLRLVVSSIQVLSEHHGWEAWANFPREQHRLLELLKKTRAEGVVFLSGDRHYAEISRLDQGDFYPLYDITSSGLNQHFPTDTPNPNRFREGGYYLKENFGVIEIDWNRPDPILTVRIIDESGWTRLEKQISLGALRV